MKNRSPTPRPDGPGASADAILTPEIMDWLVGFYERLWRIALDARAGNLAAREVVARGVIQQGIDNPDMREIYDLAIAQVHLEVRGGDDERGLADD